MAQCLFCFGNRTRSSSVRGEKKRYTNTPTTPTSVKWYRYCGSCRARHVKCMRGQKVKKVFSVMVCRRKVLPFYRRTCAWRRQRHAAAAPRSPSCARYATHAQNPPRLNQPKRKCVSLPNAREKAPHRQRHPRRRAARARSAQRARHKARQRQPRNSQRASFC